MIEPLIRFCCTVQSLLLCSFILFYRGRAGQGWNDCTVFNLYRVVSIRGVLFGVGQLRTRTQQQRIRCATLSADIDSGIFHHMIIHLSLTHTYLQKHAWFFSTGKICCNFQQNKITSATIKKIYEVFNWPSKKFI